MKKTLAKVLALALCAILLVTGTVFVTLAYLQDQTTALKNTFTSANISITLHEGQLAADGFTVDTDTRVTEQTNKYHLIPDKEYIKDPTITIEAGSEQCLLFFAMKNTMLPAGNSIEETDASYRNIYQQIQGYGWKPFANTDGSCKYQLSAEVLQEAGLTDSWADGNYMIFYHLRVFNRHESDQTVRIFDGFSVEDSLKDGIKTWNDANGNGQRDKDAEGNYIEEELVIEIIAFAVQAQGFAENTGKDIEEASAESAFISSGFGFEKSANQAG